MKTNIKHELDRITIRGFKSIRELDNFELSNLNIFIGGNGSAGDLWEMNVIQGGPTIEREKLECLSTCTHEQYD